MVIRWGSHLYFSHLSSPPPRFPIINPSFQLTTSFLSNSLKGNVLFNDELDGFMKIHTECVPCLLKRCIFEAQLSTTNPHLQQRIVKESLQLLSKIYDPNKVSATVASILHQHVYALLDNSDPYYSLKQQSNTVALSLLPQVTKLVEESEDSLKASMLCSIIGNMMDFGIEGASETPSDLLTRFNKFYEQGFAYDDFKLVCSRLARAKKILFFTDNCGEIVFDKLLCQQLKQRFSKLEIILVVKGTPVLSDATLEDALALSFSTVVDEIETTGCFAVGVDFSCLPKEVVEHLKSSDLIFCKGMANYEAFSESCYSPIIYLLRTKCHPIAASMNVPVHGNILKMYS